MFLDIVESEMPSKKKDQQLLVQPEEKLKNSNVFLEPNLTLSGRTEILAFYKEKSEFLGDIKELTKEQIASQSVHTLVELLYYLRKDPEFFDSEEFDFIETNLSELFIDLDILALTSKVLDEEIEVDFSLISFEFYELEQIQEKYNNQPEKIAFFKKLLSADSIDEVEKQAVFDFFDIVESIDLAKQSKGLSTEKIQALLDSESSTDFLKKAFLHLDEFDQETKDAFLLQVESVDKSDLADCVISLARSGEISPEAFSYLEGLSSYYIKIIIKNLLSNNIFDEAYPYFESIWSNKDILYSLIEYEDEDITQSSFGIDLLKQFVGTKDRQEDFINQYVYSRGFQEFIANEKIFEILDPGLQLSKEWFLHFFASLQYSRDADLLTIPNEFGEMFELHDDILTSDITDGYNSKDIFFPEEWRKKIASKDLDQKDAELFLRRISYGRKESIIGIGGNELLTKVFEYEYGENVLRDVLYSCIENGWAKTPNELKDLFKNQKWDFFPLALLKTNDVQMIAIVAGKSRATVTEIPSDYLENNESLVRVFFKGCTQSEVKDALESELFQEAYPEYVEYANNLTSHGEKAMVIRCAVKDISLEEVSELIALARVQQHTLYKTTALLTGIHDTDIYWEDRKDRTVEGLFWDDELKRYVLEESNERISVKNLKDHILMNANPDDYESVFFLLNLAEEENNTLLKEEESLTQEDYNYIFDSLVGRTVSSIDVLKELGKRAGYDKPEDYESALVDSLAGYPTASSIENILALSEGSITVTRFKELSYSYLNLEIRFSPDTCKVMFDYAESLGEPYSQEEKRTFWNKFVSDFKEKGNIATLGADEVKVFLDEKVVEPSEARKLLEKYLSQGHTNGTELKKLFEYTVFSQEQIEELLEVYTSKSGSIDLHVLSVFHEFVGEHEYESPIISLNFSKYIDQKIDFGYLVAYLGKFNQYVTPEQVKNKVKEIAISGLKVTNELVDLMHNYDFDKSECRMLCEFGISKHIIATEAFIELHKKAEYS